LANGVIDRLSSGRFGTMEKENAMDKGESNRKNAERSTGPHDTTSTRRNAVRHGLLAKGLTELADSDAYESLIHRLTETYRPVGDLEKFIVRRIAFHMIRLQRIARLEAEYITSEIHPPVKQGLADLLGPSVVEPGLPAAVGARGAINLVSGFQRYETSIENKLYRDLNYLERLQRSRKGGFVPAPESIDVSIHSQPGGEA
jgi:hypothetical protein